MECKHLQAREPQQPATPQATDKSGAATGRKRMAIVEDEPFMADLIRTMLCHADEDVDVDVEVFHLGADLLKSSALHQFHSIVMDLSLPDIDGFDLMDTFATLQMDSSIVLISGQSQAALKASKLYGKGIGLSVCATLCKPFSRDELLMALHSAA
jgi:CheY-like chemotaxis protein